MLDTMEEYDGIGLASNQVGLNMSMFVTSVINVGNGIICNPKWKPTILGVKYKMIEGCLSFPGWIVPVERYDAIIAEWQSFGGEKFKYILKGLAAQVFQHESEHLFGQTFMQHLTPAQQKTINKSL